MLPLGTTVETTGQGPPGAPVQTTDHGGATIQITDQGPSGATVQTADQGHPGTTVQTTGQGPQVATVQTTDQGPPGTTQEERETLDEVLDIEIEESVLFDRYGIVKHDK